MIPAAAARSSAPSLNNGSAIEFTVLRGRSVLRPFFLIARKLSAQDNHLRHCDHPPQSDEAGMNSRFAKHIFFATFLGLAFAASAPAQTYKVEKESIPAPQELAAPIRDTLTGEALRISGPQGLLCEIWLRKAVPAAAAADQGLGIAYGQLEDGTLFGAIRFAAASKDYRQQTVQPGVYTMRYALQPVDGNHLGVSPDRDFLLVAPAALDTSPASITGKDFYNLSRKASGTSHPSVWSLVTTEGSPATLPGMGHVEDGDLWVLYFKANLQPEGGAATPLSMGLVLVGHAPEA
jgi:hypothetical protein